VFTTPLEKHLYLFGNDKGAFPFTLAIGKIEVEAQLNGEYTSVEKMEFYLGYTLQFTDTEAPYSWAWVQPSFWKHRIRVIAYYDFVNSTRTISNEMMVWKLF
jgi:hypothetical protein